MLRSRTFERAARIRVVGVGNAGINAVNRMIATGLHGVEFITINSDRDMRQRSAARHQIRMGDGKGEGGGGVGYGDMSQNPERAARQAIVELYQALAGSDMVFITAGMGGETSAGASAIVAEVARKQGALVIGVVTYPFLFEGQRRAIMADSGINRLKSQVDTLIVLANDRLLRHAYQRLPLAQTFSLADDLLRQAVQAITELVTVPGLINLDFADIRTIMAGGGTALMTIGKGRGPNRALVAADQAICSNLAGVSIDGAHGVIFNVAGGGDMTLHEVNCAATRIRARVHTDANIFFGAVINEQLQDEVHITVIATGFDEAIVTSPRPGTTESGPGSGAWWRRLSLYNLLPAPAKHCYDTIDKARSSGYNAFLRSFW
jgi:cell division protein FtsZ